MRTHRRRGHFPVSDWGLLRGPLPGNSTRCRAQWTTVSSNRELPLKGMPLVMQATAHRDSLASDSERRRAFRRNHYHQHHILGGSLRWRLWRLVDLRRMHSKKASEIAGTQMCGSQALRARPQLVASAIKVNFCMRTRDLERDLLPRLGLAPVLLPRRTRRGNKNPLVPSRTHRRWRVRQTALVNLMEIWKELSPGWRTNL